MNILKSKSGKAVNLLLSVIALFIIIFAVVLVASKGLKGNTSYDAEFKDNLANMQEIAKEHFANNPPNEIGGSKIVTLDEMYELGLLDETLTYGKTKCDTEKSYILITKMNDSQYKVKSSLVCGNKSDILYERIKASTFIIDADGNIKTDNNKVLENDHTDNSTDNVVTDKDGRYSKSEYCSTVGCTIERIESTCSGEYEWEHVRKEAYCPSGYTPQNGLCVRSVTESADATTTSNSYIAIFSALIKTNESVEYADPIPTTPGGTTCPTGYKLVNGSCYKYAQLITTTTPGGLTCPNGYTMNNGSCYKYAQLLSNTTYGCPSGYTKYNNICRKYIPAKPVTTTTYSCPSGFTKNGTKCYRDATKSYSPWGNPTSTETTSVVQAVYEYELSKKVLVGSTVRNGIKWYTYSTYKRTRTYSCPYGGVVSGTKCVANAYSSTNTTYSCSQGTLTGSQCLFTANLIPTTTTYCPSGYTRSGNTCYIKTNPTQGQGTTTSYCPTGYTRSGNTCYIKTNPITTPGTTTYDCPKGFTKTGTGSNIKCSRKVTGNSTYYCENANAKLVGDKCHLEVNGSPSTSCPIGYGLAGDGRCYKYTTDTTGMLYKIVEYKYSSEKEIPGFERTGYGTYTYTCTPITK